jgi:hypothetical protein
VRRVDSSLRVFRYPPIGGRATQPQSAQERPSPSISEAIENDRSSGAVPRDGYYSGLSHLWAKQDWAILPKTGLSHDPTDWRIPRVDFTSEQNGGSSPF